MELSKDLAEESIRHKWVKGNLYTFRRDVCVCVCVRVRVRVLREDRYTFSGVKWFCLNSGKASTYKGSL